MPCAGCAKARSCWLAHSAADRSVIQGGSGGYADDREAGGDVGDHGSARSDTHVVTEVDSLSHRRASADEHSVPASHVPTDGGVGHHACVIAKRRVVSDRRAVRDEGMCTETHER